MTITGLFLVPEIRSENGNFIKFSKVVSVKGLGTIFLTILGIFSNDGKIMVLNPIEWCLNSNLHSGGLNPGVIGQESSALTTRPRLLTIFYITLHNLISSNLTSSNKC